MLPLMPPAEEFSGEELSLATFRRFSQFLKQQTGITLADNRRFLVVTRLQKRCQVTGHASIEDYIGFVVSGRDPAETVQALECLTTNETYFWREPQHYEHVRARLNGLRGGGPVLFWSAACSTGEEPYSLAMLADSCLPSGNWGVLGTDIDRQVLQAARSGYYDDARVRQLPEALRQRYLQVDRSTPVSRWRVSDDLRVKLELARVNLIQPLPEIGPFNFIFLRNVLLYFDEATRRHVVGQLIQHLKPTGFLYVSVTESLREIAPALEREAPGVYRLRKPA